MSKANKIKTSTKLLIVAFFMLIVGVTLIILACTVFSKDFAGGKSPRFAMLIPGIFLSFMTIPLWFLGFLPRIAKAGIRLQNEALDSAANDFKSAATKSADLVAPAVTILTKAAKAATDSSESDSQKMFCAYCGKEILVDSAFCKFCGAKQD